MVWYSCAYSPPHHAPVSKTEKYPAPPAIEAGKGRQRQGARHVSDTQTLHTATAVIGIDIGKNTFHVVGLDQRGAIVLRQRWSHGQVEARFANMSPCLAWRPASARITSAASSRCAHIRGTHVPGGGAVHSIISGHSSFASARPRRRDERSAARIGPRSNGFEASADIAWTMRSGPTVRARKAMTSLDASTVARLQRPGSQSPHHPGMVWISGGTFRMGSDKHYPDEAQVHRVTVDGFWMGGREAGNYDPAQPDSRIPRKIDQGRLALVRAELLQALPAGCAPRGAGRHIHESCRFPMHQARSL